MDEAGFSSARRTIKDDAELPRDAARRMPLLGATEPRQALDEPLLDRRLDEHRVQTALAPTQAAAEPAGGIHRDVERVPVLLGLAVLQEALDHVAFAGEKRDRDGFERRDLLRGLGLRIAQQRAGIAAPSAAEAGFEAAVLDFQRAAEEAEPARFEEGVDVAIFVGETFDGKLRPQRPLGDVEQFLRDRPQQIHQRAEGQRADAADKQRVGRQRGIEGVETHEAPVIALCF